MRQKLLLLLCFGMFLFTGKAFSQDISVSGTVKNEKGEPISAASIKIKFSKGGTIADDQGNFSIKTSIGKILVISALGYESKDVQAESEMNIVLKQSTSANALTDVVVTANGIRREQRSLGYDAPTLKSDELMQGQSMSILTALTGRVAGVNITSTTGAPGGSTRVVLRGGSSITGSNNALIVVDGIPYSNTLINGGNSLTSVDFGNTGNDISPNDVASITVLEGPSAAALYGSRASNGALIITTKTGSSTKKQEITFSTSNTFSSILKLPDFQNEYGQGYSTASFGTQDSIVFTPVDYGDNFSWGIPFDGVVRPWGQTIDGVQLKKPYSADKNNVKDFFKTGFVTNNNVSISSGTDKMNYFLGLNAENSNGVYPGNSDTYNRYSVRFNGKAQLSNNFTASINFNYTNIGGGYVAQGQASGSVLSNIYQTPRDIPLNTMGDLNNKYNSYGYTDASGNAHPDQYGFYALYTLSPYYILQNFKNNMNLDRATGGVNLIYQPTSWLNITDRITTDFYAIRTTSITPKFSFYPADPGTNGQYQSSQIQQNVGNYSLASFNLNEVNNDLMVTAKHKFENGITGSVLIGNNIYQNKFNTTTTSTNVSGGLIVPNWYNLGNSNGPVAATNNIQTTRLSALYGEIVLGYKDFLYLDATGRNDITSTLPVNNNSYFYPSLSGSFIFSNLFQQSSFSKILNYGKLRASIARVGNTAPPYELTSTYSPTSFSDGFGTVTFPFNGVPGLQVGSTIGNPNLKPEITGSWEIGTELDFLQSRLSADFTYYTNKSKNQILTIPIPGSTGYGFKVVNAGVLQNKGVELTLRGTPIKTNNFSLELFGTYSKNTSKVLSLMEGVQQVTIGGFNGMAIVAAVGHPYGEFYAVDNQKENGHTVVSSRTGEPLPTANAQYLGSYNPKYIASFGGDIRLKNWSLSFVFNTKQGGVYYSQTKSYLDFVGTSKETGGNRQPEIWSGSVINTGTAAAPVYATNTTAKYNKYDYYVNVIPVGQNIVDASFIKLQNLELDYLIPTNILNKTPFGNLTVGLYGNNLFIWTPKSNQFVDPEQNASGAGNEQGFDFGSTLSLRNYGFNIKVSF